MHPIIRLCPIGLKVRALTESASFRRKLELSKPWDVTRNNALSGHEFCRPAFSAGGEQRQD
jgi:hypothetical protein